MNRILSGLGVLAVGLCWSVAAQAEVKQPQRIIDRSLTTPGSQLTVGGDIGFLSIKAIDDRTSSSALGVVASYGVSDQLEVSASYAFGLKEFEAKGTLLVGAGYGLLQSGSLLLSVDAKLGYDILGEGLAPLNLGARVQFMLNKDMDIHSGGGQLTVTLDGGEEIMGVSPPKPIFLSLPVGFGYQSGNSIYAFVDTSIGTIEIADAESGFIFADFIPLKIGAFFSPSNTLDLGASIDFFDLKNAGDAIALFGSARLHM